MAYSDGYRAIRDQHRADILTALGVSSADIHFGPPEDDDHGNHVVISGDMGDSEFGTQFSSGRCPSMTVTLDCEAWLTYPTGDDQ